MQYTKSKKYKSITYLNGYGKIGLGYLKYDKDGTSIFLEDVTSSLFAEECPSTTDVLSTSTGLVYCYIFFNSQVYFFRITVDFYE